MMTALNDYYEWMTAMTIAIINDYGDDYDDYKDDDNED